ncbi:putative DNA primase/helicase [Kushneria avicenniae]|uniref:Putative DNA primase/helicase n=1 Tax=Kushneria avicenniae TaxID=402385 RepID=A0A1I1ICX9_9GAMM|nr:toprim domain-containing protein [Kushneria avicenniae]SFC34074.1 putative DNA primase/helicase [Kushneria avicenniae]
MAEHETIAKIRRVSAAALEYAELLLSEWLPEGKRQGSEWQARNTVRGDRHAGSFGVSLANGKWNDFADSDARGGDLVSLLCYLRSYRRQVDAAMEIDARLGLGVFRSSRSGMPAPSSPVLDAAAIEAFDTRQKAMEQEQARNREAAAERAKRYWDSAKRASAHHPYLIAKRLPVYNLRQSGRGWLMVPLYAEGEMVNLQWIMPNGRKRFLKGGRVTGAYSLIGDLIPGGRLFVCEGWATGATLHRLTGDPVACAMNAGNLEAVALYMKRALNGSLELVIAGDDDRHTEGNPGKKMANDAAVAAGALVLYPKWPEGAPEDATDFNDLYCWHRQRIDGERRRDRQQSGQSPEEHRKPHARQKKGTGKAGGTGQTGGAQ